MGQVILFAPYLERRKAAQTDPFGFTFWLSLFIGMAAVALVERE